MEEIINFKDYTKNKPDSCKDYNHLNSWEFQKNPGMYPAEKVFNTVQESLKNVFMDINWEKQKKIAEENAANFRKKYKAVYAFMPNDTKARISYLANIMLNLVQEIFYHPNEDTRLQAFFDYGDFLYKEMEPAMYYLENECRKYRKTIPFFKFEMVEEIGLEDTLRRCLENIIFWAGEGEEEEGELLAELYRLFNLDIFLNRMMAH